MTEPTCDGRMAGLEPAAAAVKLDLPDGVPPLSSLYIYLAGACNLACRHCWIAPQFLAVGQSATETMFVSFEHIRKAVNEGRPLGLNAVKLTGGEPMLHPQFREIVAWLVESGISITMETNGTLLTPELASFLKATGQVNFISVSLDGADAATHEALRMVPGSFDLAVNGIQALVLAGYRPQMICSLHRDNIAQAEQVIRLASELGCGSVKFNLIQSVGRGEGFQRQSGLTIVESLSLQRQAEDEWSPRWKMPVYFDVPPAFRSLTRFMQGGCGQCAVLNILGLLPSGALALCGIGNLVPELIYGNIAHEDLKHIWLTSPGLAQLRALIPDGLVGICAECLHRRICMGHCVANNYFHSGNLAAPYGFCQQADELGLFPATRKRESTKIGG